MQIYSLVRTVENGIWNSSERYNRQKYDAGPAVEHVNYRFRACNRKCVRWE
jgi:hypothetical protein